MDMAKYISIQSTKSANLNNSCHPLAEAYLIRLELFGYFKHCVHHSLAIIVTVAPINIAAYLASCYKNKNAAPVQA